MEEKLIIAEKIIQDCYEHSLTDALKIHKMNAQFFFPLLIEVPSLSEKFVRAQQARAELYMAEMIGIADDKDIDPNRARNMIQVREKYAAKLHPNKFSDRIDINVNQHVDIRGALDEAKNRIRDVIQIAATTSIESHTDLQLSATGLEPAEIENRPKNELDELLS